MIFKSPIYLFFIPFVLALIYVFKKGQRPSRIVFPSSIIISQLGTTQKTRFRNVPHYLRAVSIVLIIIALSGPRAVSKETVQKQKGIDIVLAVDASGSMAAEDFNIGNKRVNRLQAVKNVVESFIKERTSDRIGLVAFAGLAYTVCPLTTDNLWLLKNLERIELGLIDDGTAIGSAIVSSLSRLKVSDAKSKVMILLTDGMNNAGKVDPIDAARVAEAFGIKIYTIGAGTKGYAPFPQYVFGRKVYTQRLSDLDEESLKKIADITGGKYFSATDIESLREVYEQIDELEKTEIEEFGYFEYEELFVWFLIGGMLLLAAEEILLNTLFFKIP
ncbi:MAG: VWA domain-containing protein [Candidatus Omnitrophica bacterium]|nr:VWA domain-containing protein [Candidatus Omnitrophota bacterium]MBU1996301.1 VWA domain-containing protein [Candidatus Omnitrophota bacterium]MBU4334331.1 VWA domain-containing protein [Candidatus Omnitrophota bacterium]